METLFFQTSLVAAFIAGMVALFAPCCITFLLPAYLGSVFKEKEKVLLMTLVFGAGIFVMLLPAVLGVSLISTFLFRYHNVTYIAGGIVMLLVSIVSLLGLKLPMPHIKSSTPGKPDVVSIFMLGIFSGITSACCAPVLIGILAFTFLSPNFWGSMMIGSMYVLGMVAPLLFISIFLSGKMPKAAFLRSKITSISLFGKNYKVFLSNFVAFVIFFITGSATLFLTMTGQLSMEKMSGFTSSIQNASGFANQYVGNNVLVNIIFLLFVIFGIYKISKKV